jgi:hypothetical protein
MVDFVGQSIGFRGRDDLLVIHHTSLDPVASEWVALLDALKRWRSAPGLLRKVVFSDGGAPDAGQRAALNGVLDWRHDPTSVVTDSFAARAATNALAIFGAKVQSFPSRELDRALENIGASAADRRFVLESRDRLRVAVGRRLATPARTPS